MPISLTPGNEYFYSDEFKVVIRSCKEMILARASFAPFDNPAIKHAYRGNFHKLLRSIGGENPSIPEDMIWVNAFINGIENPNQDFSDLKGIWLVDKSVVTSIIQVSRVVRE
ncbi:hypothetical protein CF8_0068 [Aeromonas phage CF8]|nr:hypothetical protein CF8_0068 [Aeromonas phage CF8]